jgi:polysaccharide pyruvyl transferase WcaK-like protein
MVGPLTPLKAANHLLSRAAGLTKPTLAYVGGWLGRSNLGDEMLLTAAGRLFPDMHVVPVRGRRHELLVDRMFPPFDASVLAGGTLINMTGSLPQAETYSARSRYFFVFGTGVADPNFEPNRTDGHVLSRWETVLRRSRFVGVRGPLSAKLLTDAGIDGVEVVGDPALALAGSVRPDPHVPMSLGLNVGTSGGHIWGDEKGLAREMLALASWARRTGWDVHWFVVWPQDMGLTHEIATRSRTGAHVHAIYADPRRFLKLVGAMSFFVGMKLHAVVLATCAAIPSIMLEYRPKCRDYMASIDHEGFVVRTDEVSARDLRRRLDEMVDHRDDLSRYLEARVGRLREFQARRAKEIATQICG